jgi:hypothetical protein
MFVDVSSKTAAVTKVKVVNLPVNMPAVTQNSWVLHATLHLNTPQSSSLHTIDFGDMRLQATFPMIPTTRYTRFVSARLQSISPPWKCTSTQYLPPVTSSYSSDGSCLLLAVAFEDLPGTAAVAHAYTASAAVPACCAGFMLLSFRYQPTPATGRG